MVAGELPGEEPAEAPADDHDGAIMAEALNTFAQPLDRVGSPTEVPSLLPAIDAEVRARELPPQRKGRLVVAEEPGNDQHGLSFIRPARPSLAEGSDEATEIPRQLGQMTPAVRRSVVTLPPLRRGVTVQRYSPPISCCST